MHRFALFALLLLPACRTIEPAVLPGVPQTNRPAVFVADGAGDFRACSESFRQTVAEDHLNLEVITFVWSHGYLRNLSDQTDAEHMRKRGMLLADVVRQHSQRFPDAPISLVGHSAGCGVVLAAAENLPPDSIERVVLLSPSNSEHYDMRPALTATRDGIDAFICEADWLWLGVLVRMLGTTDDPQCRRACGRYGFSVPQGDAQYDKLHVYRWTPEQKAIGHDGGHFGCYQPAFIREQVLPWLVRPIRSEQHETTSPAR